MTLLNEGVVDCLGFEIVESLSWDGLGSKKDGNQALEPGSWGFLISSRQGASPLKDGSRVGNLFGTVGPIQTHRIQEPCLGIPLQGALDPQSALIQFALACGLSIIEKAKLELGDTIVVAGANLLALSVLVAASVQSTRNVCVIPDSEKQSPYRQVIEKLADALLEFEDISTFDSELDAFLALSRGKTVYVDALGQPGPVHAMATRLEKFGTLLLCRQEVTSSILVNIADVHHRKSAQFIYWARPETIEQALMLAECCRRAAGLFHWKRVHTPMILPIRRES